MPRIVVFTNKSAWGAGMLEQMKRGQIPIAAIIIDTTRWDRQKRRKKLKRSLKRLGLLETLRLVVKNVKRRLLPQKRKAWREDSYYQAFSDAIYRVPNFNGAECEDILRAIEPDLIILGGARIIRKNIIDIPRVGILNAHPGLLPQYRGVDVIPWAILNGDPVGVSIHFIDEGIDTGRIVARETIAITPGDTLGSLKERASEIAGQLVGEAVMELFATGDILAQAQSAGEGQYYHRMPGQLRQAARKKLESLSDQANPGEVHK